MSVHFIDVASFALPGELEDRTVHVLVFADGARLELDRRQLRRQLAAGEIARARSDREARRLARYADIGERDAEHGGLSTVDVASHFREGPALVYARRSHLVRRSVALTFTWTAPFAQRAALDGRADELLAGVRFREGDVRPRDAELYLTNELAFRPGGRVTDLTVHAFEGPLPNGHVLGLLVAQTPLPRREGLVAAVRADVAAQGRRLPFYRVTELSERRVAGAPAVLVLGAWSHRGIELVARELHVVTPSARLLFTATAPLAHEAATAEIFERLTSTLELDARAPALSEAQQA